MKIPHVLALPYPAQGHVSPMLELMQRVAQHGIKVTFVNIDFNHRRVTDALQINHDDLLGENIDMVSIPDGLEPWEDRTDIKKLQIAMELVMPKKLEELIEKINEATDDNKITCIFADGIMGWALDVARNMGIIKLATFWSASAATLALIHNIPKMIDEGLVNKEDGTLTKSEFHPLPSLPAVNSKTFLWACFDDEAIRKISFKLLVDSNQFMKLADIIICNSAYKLEPTAFSNIIPKVLPIGPLSATTIPGNKAGNFWPEDLSCLSWLDQQPFGSVIYVAFGSSTVLDQTQFRELALGLELTNKPFLWVVRPNITTGGYPEGFQDRIGNRGNLVAWAPQQKVLNHPSVACFMSHCGWNSTTEGVSNGVPFLCWPYFSDQFSNQTYICDVWNIGLGFEKDDEGIVRKDEMVKKVEQLLSDNNYKVRAMELKEKVVNSVQEDGCSTKNISNFIKWMK